MAGRDDLRNARARAHSNGRVEIVSITASDVLPANVRWAWQGWVPLGMQSALIGMPGFGKTTLIVRLAAAVTRGELEGDLENDPGDVLIISYEDVIEVRLRPMVEAAGADLDRVHFVKCNRTGHVIDLTAHLERIEEIVVEHRARLLAIDPLVAGLPAGKINSFRDQDVRSVLAPIAALAEEHDLAVLTTGHFSKAAMSALLGTGGSIGFVGAPRSILAFGPDPTSGADPDRDRVLAHAKSNVGRLQVSRKVMIIPAWLDPFGQTPIETSRAELGETTEVCADDLVQSATARDAPKVKAMKFLSGLLADGPHAAAEVYGLSADDGIAVRTLKRAKVDLGVESYQEGRSWYWKLPEDDEADDAE
jgi:hypothetical protein